MIANALDFGFGRVNRIRFGVSAALRFPLAVLAAEFDPITSADLVVGYETALKGNTEVLPIGMPVSAMSEREALGYKNFNFCGLFATEC